MKKITIHGVEYYEAAVIMYFNSKGCKYIQSKKLIEDNAINTYEEFMVLLEETVGASFFVFRSVEYDKIQYTLGIITRAGNYIKPPSIISNKKVQQ